VVGVTEHHGEADRDEGEGKCGDDQSRWQGRLKGEHASGRRPMTMATTAAIRRP
jgi:hypothetical protein